MQAIWKRISVRNFLERAVPSEKIDILLDAGMQAPSAGNARPWHFVVEDRREKIKKITPFTMAINSIPCVTPIKHVKDLYEKNFKSLS